MPSDDPEFEREQAELNEFMEEQHRYGSSDF